MTREEKEHIGKYVLELAKLLEDGCYQQEIFLGAAHIIDEALEQEPCEDWYDVPSDEMTLEQARQAVKDLRKKLLEYLELEPTTKNDLGVDAISRDEVCRYVAEFVNHEFSTREEEELIDNIITGIEHMPSVTLQEPKTGYWIEENINEWSCKVFCSECGCAPPFEYVSDGDVYSASGYGVINKTKYCPNCGTRMVEPQESEN